jgi:hypothetical protein
MHSLNLAQITLEKVQKMAKFGKKAQEIAKNGADLVKKRALLAKNGVVLVKKLNG